MTIQEQIQQYRNQATMYQLWAREAKDKSGKTHWMKLAQAKMESAKLLQEAYLNDLEANDGDNLSLSD